MGEGGRKKAMSSIYLIEPSRWEGAKRGAEGGKRGRGFVGGKSGCQNKRKGGGRAARGRGKERTELEMRKRGPNERGAGCWVTYK